MSKVIYLKDEEIEKNLNEIKQNIKYAAEKSGRKYEDITLIAVTKTVNVESINKAIACGIQNIGENKVQELLLKYDDINKKDVKFHLIGHLQTNKVKYIVDKVSMIHSVDSVKLAKEIDLRAGQAGITMPVLIEINIGGEESKSGINPSELEYLLHEISELKHIIVKGLMAIPPQSSNPEKTRLFFRRMYQLFVDIRTKKIDNIYMDFLSMGMSGDYIIAIEEGANIVRIGTSIFGQRKYDLK